MLYPYNARAVLLPGEEPDIGTVCTRVEIKRTIITRQDGVVNIKTGRREKNRQSGRADYFFGLSKRVQLKTTVMLGEEDVRLEWTAIRDPSGPGSKAE